VSWITGSTFGKIGRRHAALVDFYTIPIEPKHLSDDGQKKCVQFRIRLVIMTLFWTKARCCGSTPPPRLFACHALLSTLSELCHGICHACMVARVSFGQRLAHFCSLVTTSELSTHGPRLACHYLAPCVGTFDHARTACSWFACHFT
jgi:hypothetical protein